MTNTCSWAGSSLSKLDLELDMEDMHDALELAHRNFHVLKETLEKLAPATVS